jgi:hypothetical protein
MQTNLEYIYYKTNNNFGKVPVSTVEDKLEVIQKVAEAGGSIINKQGYDECLRQDVTKRMQDRFRDFRYVLDVLSVNDNKLSIQAWSKITGIPLAKTWKVRQEQIREYYGEELTAWETKQQEAREAEEKARQEAERKQHEVYIETTLKDYREGKEITSEAFAALCSEYSIPLHGRTKGFILDKIRGFSSKNNGSLYTYEKKVPSKVWEAVAALNYKLSLIPA